MSAEAWAVIESALAELRLACVSVFWTWVVCILFIMIVERRR